MTTTGTLQACAAIPEVTLSADPEGEAIAQQPTRDPFDDDPHALIHVDESNDMHSYGSCVCNSGPGRHVQHNVLGFRRITIALNPCRV